MDFGYPQNSEIDTLKMYITTESIKSEMAVVSLHFIVSDDAEIFRGKTRPRSRYRLPVPRLGGDQM